MADGDSGGEGNASGGGHIPTREMWPEIWSRVPHYYGDVVRQLMLGSAALMLFAAPFYADSLHAELPFEVFGTLILVSLAAFTNPWNKHVITAAAIANGVGMTIYQTWALYGYGVTGPVVFALREMLAILFMFAFYFSIKTLRAMILHQVGKRDSISDFDEDEQELREHENMKPTQGERAGD